MAYSFLTVSLVYIPDCPEIQGRFTEYHVTLTYLPQTEAANRFAGLFLAAQKGQAFDYGKLLEHFRSEVARIVDLLARIFPETKLLSDSETLTYLHGLVSDSRHNVRVPETPMFLDSLLSDCPLVGGFHPQLGMHRLKVLSVLGFPYATFPGILDQLNTLPFEYRWSTRFICLDKLAAKKELEEYKRKWFAKRKGVVTLIKELMTKEESILSDSDAIQKAEDAEGALLELGSDHVSYGYYTSTIVLAGSDEEALASQASAVERVINGLGFVVRQETVNSVDAWLGTLPGNTRQNVRRPLLNTINVAHLLPGMSASWEGQTWNSHLNAPALLVGESAGSTPFRLSLHVGDVGHTLILGPTGAGKSTLLNFLGAQFLRYQDAQVFIFDKGRSAFALTLGMGGDFYDLGAEDSTVSFQPLRAIDDATERQWAHDFLVSIIEMENVTVTPEVKAHLWDALETLASSPIEQRTLLSLTVFLQDKTLRQTLEPFTTNGPYGRLLDNSFDNLKYGKWACFEMEALMETPSVIAPVLAYLFHRLEQRFTGAPTLLVLDEAWLFLDHPTFSARIRAWLKTLRKKNVSVVFATQSLVDVDSSSIAATLKEACFTKLFLPNAAALQPDAQAFYKRFGLNERQVQIIAEATPKQDYYYTSPYGCRLFSVRLGTAALAYCASASPETINLIRRVLRECNSTAEFNLLYQEAKGLPCAARRNHIHREAA